MRSLLIPMPTEEKLYISANQLMIDSFHLGANILDSGFRPNFIVGIWRGGTPVGIVIQELLDFAGVETDHIAIRTSSYRGINDQREQVRVHGMGYIVRNINYEDSLLIVDDVFDSGLSIEAVINHLSTRTRRNTPHDIRVATPWFKPNNNKTDRTPDYYLYETDSWLVFPHELKGLTSQEIIDNKLEIGSVLNKVQSLRNKNADRVSDDTH